MATPPHGESAWWKTLAKSSHSDLCTSLVREGIISGMFCPGRTHVQVYSTSLLESSFGWCSSGIALSVQGWRSRPKSSVICHLPNCLHTSDGTVDQSISVLRPSELRRNLKV